MRTSDITLVFQGAFKPYTTRDGESCFDNIRQTRRTLPGARIILSTWEGTEIPAALPVDAVVFSADPGGLAPLKLDDDKANNINRQILSTRAGLDAVTTSHAVKLRTDCWLSHAGFLDFHAEQRKRDAGRERLLACSFFTLDPTVFERVAFHLSDWFHFGPTDLLRAYWAAPPMSAEQARFYESHRHVPDSSIFERKFRTRFAAEQHLCTHFASTRGYACPQYLNDGAPEVLRDYHRFLAREVMLLDPWQIGLQFRKYDWVGASLFQCMNNLMHLDWLRISGQHSESAGDEARLAAMIAERSRKKEIMRLAFRHSRRAHGFLFDPSGKGARLRHAAHRILRLL